MKKIVFLIFIFGTIVFAQDIYQVTTKNGQIFKGQILNQDNIIEWRKDLYEYEHSNGTKEQFFLQPPYTGKIQLSQIASIKAISQKMAPIKYISLSNNMKAKLVLKYRIQLKNKNFFYISDFITLSHYYIFVENSAEKKKIYLTTIKNLKLLKKSIPNKKYNRPKKTLDKKNTAISKNKNINPNIAQPLKISKKNTAKTTSNSILFIIVFVLSILIIALLVTVLYLYSKYRKTSTRKKKKKQKKRLEKKRKKTTKSMAKSKNKKKK